MERVAGSCQLCSDRAVQIGVGCQVSENFRCQCVRVGPQEWIGWTAHQGRRSSQGGIVSSTPSRLDRLRRQPQCLLDVARPVPLAGKVEEIVVHAG